MKHTPFFSIVIPTYNRPAQLAACLQACSRLDYPRDCFEVIAVDDGGTIPLDGVVAPFAEAMALRLLRQENAGPAAARNRGAGEARGEFLAFTDDDCMPSASWLQALAAHCAASPDSALGGQTINALPGNPYATASQLQVSYLSTYYNAVPHAARFLPSNNLAFPAEGFRAIAGFDETYPRAAAEDRELCDRWLYHGRRLIYVEEAMVYHAHELTLRTFLRQHFHYGRGAYCFRQLSARRGKHRIEVEPLAFYVNMLRYPFQVARRANAPLLSFLLGLTQVATVAGFFWEQTREGPS